ncbi:MAG: hypothetical protein IJM30_12575 [Thermoguttaceae bacterium]|nr:hypothetical protein [Thermoguttaceae bacterium]
MTPKSIVLSVLCVAGLFVARPLAYSASGSPDQTVAFRSDANSERIASLCAAAKASYDPKYREGFVAVEDPEFARQEREYFESCCDELANAFAIFRSTGANNARETIAYTADEIRAYQANSPAVADLFDALRGIFSQPNAKIEISDRLVAALTTRPLDERFDVREIIRGAYAQGAGSARGYSYLRLCPNPNRAELEVVLSANVATATSANSRGVDVRTNNYGSVVATKRIYANPDGFFTTTSAVSSGSVKSKLDSFAAGMPTPFGGAIVQSKIERELPYAEQESSQKLSQRFANELDKRTNEALVELNKRIARAKSSGGKSAIRNFETSVAGSRLRASFVLGDPWQFGVASEAARAQFVPFRSESTGLYAEPFGTTRPLAPATGVADPSSRPVSRAQAPTVLPASRPSSAPAPVVSIPANAPVPSTAPLGSLGSLVSAPLDLFSDAAYALGAPAPAPPVRSAPTAPSYAARVSVPALPATSGPNLGFDLVLKLHQSAPVNAANLAVSGATLGDGGDTFESFLSKFPLLDSETLAAIFPEETGERAKSDKKFAVTFDERSPVSVRFDGGKASVVLRFASCLIDKTTFDSFEIHLTYKIERRGTSLAFVRESAEVFPLNGGNLDESELRRVKIRYFAEGDPEPKEVAYIGLGGGGGFRALFMGALDRELQNEYPVEPISLDDPKTGEKRGALIPAKVEAKGGWLAVAFRYDPNYRGK